MHKQDDHERGWREPSIQKDETEGDTGYIHDQLANRAHAH